MTVGIAEDKTGRVHDIVPDHVIKPGMDSYERGQRLRKRVVSVRPRICIERARLVTQAYRESESEHILIRRAKAFDRILKGISVYILDDELIVGHQASSQRSAPLFPEFAVDWLLAEMDKMETRPQDKFIAPDEVAREFREEIYPYWKGKTFGERTLSYLTEEIDQQRKTAVFTIVGHESHGLGHVALDYAKLLTLGIEGIKSEISENLEKLTLWKPGDYNKKLFYDSCAMICDSVLAFAGRYAFKAREMAENEDDPERKNVLLRISGICERVPRYPADNFHEALQSLWFAQLVPQIYDNGVSISPGRFDQYMYRYYASDIESKRLTREEAQELLETFWVKLTEPIKLYSSDDISYNAGYPMGQNLCVSGVGPDGIDATNDLSYRCLEAHSHMLLMQPNFSVRLHMKTPHDFLIKVCEAIKMGNGMPQILNDEVVVPVSSYVALGKTTGATPDGRKARERLADGISPTAGADLKGPTAVFRSVCTIDQRRCPNGVIFNQKINPGVLSTREEMRKFADLIRTYISLGGGHVQFNVVSADILKEAQKEPEKYRGLVVRVAGTAHFFMNCIKTYRILSLTGPSRRFERRIFSAQN